MVTDAAFFFLLIAKLGPRYISLSFSSCPPGRLLSWAVLAACLYGLAPLPAAALDPGRVQGSLSMNGQAVALTHAYAHLHDNAEAVLHHTPELRLLLVDREVPQTALAGLGGLPVETMACEGRLQGLLLKLAPQNRRVELIPLLPPSPRQPHLVCWTIVLPPPNSPPHLPPAALAQAEPSSKAPPPALTLTMHPQRVGGSFTYHSEPQTEGAAQTDLACSLSFSIPLFHEPPVTAVLTGRAAQASPQARVIRDQARALEQGNFAALRRLASPSYWQWLQAQAVADPDTWAKKLAAGLQAELPDYQHIVVRGPKATACFRSHIMGNLGYRTFILADGQWQTD